MNDFTSIYPQVVELDPNKRVNYIHGLVLGVDEFKQEEFYLLEKDRLHNRSLHGYGTVCGLDITQKDVPGGVEIKVKSGMAINYCGQVIQVSLPQCSLLDEWLASHSKEIVSELGSPASGPLSVYLMLCYRECKTDHVPLPTGPCQSLEESTAPSRIADDFSLTFGLDQPPEYHFKSPIEDLTELLLNIPVEAGGAMTLPELRELVRALIPVDEDSISSPPIPLPPVSSPAIAGAIAPENISEYFNEAFLVWVTEVKPCLMINKDESIPTDTTKNCVFLAKLNFDVDTTNGIARLDSTVEIDESQRQYLLASQDMQNYLGPLSFWTKALSDAALPSEISPVVDDSLLVHLAGPETLTGSKSFAAPIVLENSGRVTKTISLPAYQAHHGRGAANGLFNSTLPAKHLLTRGANAFNGEAIFSIPIPDDIDYTQGIQFRLVWGFEGNPEPSNISFDWRVGARFYEANDSVPALPFEYTEVSVLEVNERRNDVLVTPYNDFDNSIVLNSDHQYGAMQVSLLDPGVTISQVYLLQVELQYIANRLGRS